MPSRQQQVQIITAAARRAGIKPAILWGLYGQESDFGRNHNTSSAGAQGPFQFMPGTARSYGIDPHNFRQAAFAAAKYLAKYSSRGTRGALAAYNAGPAGNPNNPETRAYVPSVLKLARTFPGAHGGGGLGGAGGGLGGSVGSVTVPGASGTASTPAGSDGALALVQALSQQQRPQVQSAPLAVPSFSAAPVLPAGYQAPQSGGVSTPPVDTAALLSAIRTQGGDTPGQAAGSSITVNGSSSAGGATGAGRMSSKGLASFDGKPVRQDFAAQLAWARKHGWNGTVTSGFRTKAQQIAAAKSYGLQHYGPAGPLGSNHVFGHRGAVDVTDPGRLNAILDRYPGKRTLIWAGPIIGDKPHFSPTGH